MVCYGQEVVGIGNCQQTGRQINVATKQDKAFPRGGCNPRKLLLTSDHPAH